MQVYESAEVGTTVLLTITLATPIVLAGKYQAEIPDELTPLESIRVPTGVRRGWPPRNSAGHAARRLPNF